MCLILFAINEHQKYPLIIAANRDEYFNRAALYAHTWKDRPDIIAGRDQTAGGTWLGITKKGRFAAITNYRNPQSFRPNAPSRGALTSNYLTGDMTLTDYIDDIQSGNSAYNGYNLLLSETPGTITYYSNISSSITTLRSGIHGLSNHLLDTSWPKVKRGVQAFGEILQKETIQTDQLFQIMRNRRQAPYDQLPFTGIDTELERQLSSIFINIPGYGTRCTTILLIDRDNHVTFKERSFNEQGEKINQSLFSFYIDT